jgi:hypothetical protein
VVPVPADRKTKNGNPCRRISTVPDAVLIRAMPMKAATTIRAPRI